MDLSKSKGMDEVAGRPSLDLSRLAVGKMQLAAEMKVVVVDIKVIFIVLGKVLELSERWRN